MFYELFTFKIETPTTGPQFFLQYSYVLICICAFTGKRWEVKNHPSISPRSLSDLHVTAHSKQLFVNNIFIPSIDFYEYHKTKSSWCYLLASHTHTHTMLFKSNLPGSMWYVWILILIYYCSKKALRITSLNYLHNNLYFGIQKNRVLS